MSSEVGGGTALHLVGGFLGSGKTTAIIQAAKQLISAGLRVGVVTNDQGRYLVDTAFVRLADLPAVEVSGGCFCCHYDDLNQRLDQLIDEIHPDVVFAESVGSCADIVATVVKPMLSFSSTRIRPSTYSVFVDSRLLLRRVQGLTLLFSEDVIYIFDQQIQEAGLLVLNKVDLLCEPDQTLLAKWAQGRNWRFQNSLSEESVKGWLSKLQSSKAALTLDVLDIDYDRYGRGEARMAWLDETLSLKIPAGEGQQVLGGIIQSLLKILREEKAAIGHIKFIIDSGGVSTKLSLTSLEEPGWLAAIPHHLEGEIRLLVNMRAETDASWLHRALLKALTQAQEQTRFAYQETHVDFFHPAQPKPTHRMV